jgi:hypothetical protein
MFLEKYKPIVSIIKLALRGAIAQYNTFFCVPKIDKSTNITAKEKAKARKLCIRYRISIPYMYNQRPCDTKQKAAENAMIVIRPKSRDSSPINHKISTDKI